MSSTWNRCQLSRKGGKHISCYRLKSSKKRMLDISIRKTLWNRLNLVLLCAKHLKHVESWPRIRLCGSVGFFYFNCLVLDHKVFTVLSLNVLLLIFVPLRFWWNMRWLPLSRDFNVPFAYLHICMCLQVLCLVSVLLYRTLLLSMKSSYYHINVLLYISHVSICSVFTSENSCLTRQCCQITGNSN